MIASRKDRKLENDNYRELARYIADAKNDGEKVLMHWSAGSSFDDYITAICEAEAIQEQNTRSQKSKSYHLVVSFRPEDEAKLSDEDFMGIEKAFALALGFENHVRHCGVHKNTNNLHLHIAYNTIGGEKFRQHAPFRDFYKVSRVCREMEKKYGLSVDRGVDRDTPKKEGQANAKVKSIEAQTGQESLFTYILRHKDRIMSDLEKAGSWKDVHDIFLRKGLLIKPSGNGLTIKDRYGKHSAKASQIDRNLSKSNLEKIFGSYEAPATEQLRSVQVDEVYSAVPLHLGPERDKLYTVFQEEMLWRRTVLKEINDEGRAEYEANKLKWNQQREKFRRVPMLKRDRDRLYLELKEREQAGLEKIRTETSRKRDTVRALLPYTTWSQCLQHKAAQGNEVALAVLRSKTEKVQPEVIFPRQEIPINQSLEVKEWQKKKKEILDAAGLTNRNRRALLTVLKMREIFSKGNGLPKEPKYRIDGNGTVIFELPDGGTIRDTGRQINFNPHSQKAGELAAKLAQARFGKNVQLENGVWKLKSFDHDRDLKAPPTGLSR